MFRWSKKKKHAADAEKDVESDEVTQRFTVNLPNGKKTVARVNPLMPLGDLVVSVLKEKGHDPDLGKYFLELPKSPGTRVDPNSTIQQIGAQEVNIVSLASQERNHTMSMPDLSRLPPSSNQPQSFSPPSAQHHKKKRGFLSFLSKKDKKYKSELNRSFDSSVNSNFSTPPAQRTTTHPDIQRRSSDQNVYKPRPQSMFVSSNTPSTGDVSPEQDLPPLPPSRKKHRAPEPPIPEDYQTSEKQNSLLEISVEINKDSEGNTSEVHIPNKTNQLQEGTCHVLSQENKVPSGQLSCNSSDSSGYHDLSSSRCESPEDTKTNNIKTSVDVTSSDSTGTTLPERTDSVLIHSRPNDYQITETLDNTVDERSEVIAESVGASSFISNRISPGNSDTLSSNKISTFSSTTSTITSTSSFSFVEATTSTTSSSTLEANVTDSSTNAQTHSDNHNKIESIEITDQKISDIDGSKQEPTNFDINDILEGVVFDEEPWLMDLKLAKRAGVNQSDKDHMMMMETASVTSENIDQIENFVGSQRPCAFIPPPPPSEPPPPEDQSVHVGPFASTSAPIFVDKGTEVNDDNSSLATSSNKSSPGRVSSGSMHEMALCVDKMDNMTLDSPKEGDNELLKDTVSSPHISSSHKNADVHDIMWPLQKASGDASFETVPHTTGESQKVKDIDLETHITEKLYNFQNQIIDDSSLSGQITKPLTNMMPQQELDDKGVISQEGKGNITLNEDDDEYYTETIEELIIPYGPNGYDFAAARRKTDSEIVTVQKKSSLKDTEKREGSYVLSSKQDVNVQLSFTHSPTYQFQPKTAESKPLFKQSEKKEVHHSSEDFSNGNFLPPRTEIVKTSDGQSDVCVSSKNLTSEPEKPTSNRKTTDHPTSSISATKQPTSSMKITDQYHVLNRSTEQPEDDFTTPQQTAQNIKTSATNHKYENIHSKVLQKNIMYNSQTQNAPVTEEKPPTKLPNMRTSAHINNSTAFPDDELSDSYDPIFVKSRPHLLMNSHSNVLGRSTAHHTTDTGYPTSDAKHQTSFSHGAGSDAVADVDQPGSRTSAYNAESQEQQDALQRQYYALQAQFQQWQEQLAMNQSLLASQAVGSDFQAEHLQQLTEQMVMQQQMMRQLQATMLALQQQQHMHAGQEHGDFLAEFPVQINQPVAGAAEPVTVAVSRSQPAVAFKKSTVAKSDITTGRKKTKFEQELSPREQLMIAIKTFSKRELNSVPIEKTRWTPSAW